MSIPARYLLPTLPGKVHGIVGLDPTVVQCDECATTATGRGTMPILTGGIDFNPYAYSLGDQRRLCRACAKDAGWVR